MDTGQPLHIVEDRALVAALLAPRVAVEGHQGLGALIHLRLVGVETALLAIRRGDEQLALDRVPVGRTEVAHARGREHEAGEQPDAAPEPPGVAELLHASW